RKLLVYRHGVEPDDLIVASEPYGKWVAEVTGAKFMPYDIDRTLNQSKGQNVRNMPYILFENIIPEFRRFLRTRVTIFGAESTGKTTLASKLARAYGCKWLFEWARPYLENTVNEITVDSMSDIWQGQAALQMHGITLGNKPLLLQDTDLYSTIGYWDLPHWREHLGPIPAGLRSDAEAIKSDLYLITPSNIPFEPDPLRYGGNVREANDEYWIGVCETNGLNYAVLPSNAIDTRMRAADRLIEPIVAHNLNKISYDRGGL